LSKGKPHPIKVQQYVSKENQVHFCTISYGAFNKTLFQKFYNVE